MNQWTVSFTSSARDDLASHAEYLRRRHKPAAAQNLLDEVDAKISLLRTMPKAFPKVREDFLAKCGFRWMTVGGYLMFYLVDNAAHTVSIARVLPRRADWAAALVDEE